MEELSKEEIVEKVSKYLDFAHFKEQIVIWDRSNDNNSQLLETNKSVSKSQIQ